MNKARTRTIDIWYKWIFEEVEQGHLEVRHLKGVDMATEGLTKALPREKHYRFIDTMARPSPGSASKTVPGLLLPRNDDRFTNASNLEGDLSEARDTKT